MLAPGNLFLPGRGFPHNLRSHTTRLKRAYRASRHLSALTEYFSFRAILFDEKTFRAICPPSLRRMQRSKRSCRSNWNIRDRGVFLISYWAVGSACIMPKTLPSVSLQ